MIKIKNIEIKYDKLIIEAEELIIPSQGMTVIEGESGSGKTSLLKCISLIEETCDEYRYHNQDIKDRDLFKKEHISMLFQDQIFIDTLLVKDHIRLIEEAYGFHDTSYYIQQLHLEELLDKYPNQLSGGEKTRVGLLLKLMKQPDILILDEPTTSLDLEYTHIVLDILKNYSQNHIVIIASHDQEVINAADTLYKIEDHKILIKKSANRTDDVENIVSQKKIKPISFLSLGFCLKKKNMFFHLVFSLLLAFVIFLSSSCLSAFHAYDSTNNDKMSQVYQDELLIYKNPIEDYDYYQIDGSGSEFPFSQDELKMIDQIENIESIKPAYLTGSNSQLLEIDSSLDYSDYQKLGYISLLNGKKEKIITIHTENTGYNHLLECTYDEDKDYSSDVQKQFKKKKNGVYISKLLAESIGMDKIKKNTYLQFTLLVPTHIGYGDAQKCVDLKDGTYYPVAELLGKRIEVTLPVNGILTGCDMGVGIQSHLSVYLPYSYMQKQINKYKSSETFTYYHSAKKEIYQLKLEKGDTSTNEMVCQPYTPTVYKVKVNSIQNVSQVIQQLEKCGISVVHDSVKSQLSDYYENNNQIILIVSLFVFVVLIVIYGIMKYLYRKNEWQIERFIQSFGYTSKESHRNTQLRYLLDTIIIYLFMMMISFIYRYGISEMLNYPITVLPISKLYAFIFSLMIMFIVPLTALKIRKE